MVKRSVLVTQSWSNAFETQPQNVDVLFNKNDKPLFKMDLKEAIKPYAANLCNATLDAGEAMGYSVIDNLTVFSKG